MIECNTNPNLEICSPLLARIVPELLDNSFRIAVDPLYTPLDDKKRKFDLIPRIKYHLIYDETIDK